ncbi:Mov34/MPN/PAD-1 family protein [Peribacillus sp. SI8-4]|uniref:Mov34/MPN/PAD-1 family protein n=1 Tax=Peribacillus sp. SI8-4 TaxID=3048009 RepID=UPI002555517F|nr:Mov34/MPN/PAD-1 family protein [Peribacillus sp. SI8-4]
MKFNIDTQRVIKISDRVNALFHEYRQIGNKDREAGGVLLGRFIQSSLDVVVDRGTAPMKRDIRKRYFFKKHRDDHQEIVQSIWEESMETCNYLGEWHTHPEPHPTPSAHDIKEWKRVLKDTICDSDELFFIIVGTESIGVWTGNRKRLEVKKLMRC